MNTFTSTTAITTAIAVAIALVIVIFGFFGNSIFAFFSGNVTQPATSQAARSPLTTKTASATSKLSITDNVVGTGALAQRGDQVAILYKGMFQDGKVFDSSQAHKNKPLQFVVGGGRVIPGMDEGVIGMKVGGTRTIVIPPSLGYGSHVVGPIPANSTLTFEVKLVGVTLPTK